MRGRPAGLAAILIVAAAVVGTPAAARSIAPVALPVAQAVRLPVTVATPVRVCPGPQTLVVPQGATPTQPGGPVEVGAVALTGAGATAALGDTELDRAQDGEVALAARTLSGAGTLELTAAAQGRAIATSAVQTTLTPAGDLRGLDAVACATPAAEAWLVGGGTLAGERARLLLADPTPSPAVVDVLVHGPDGPVSAPSGQGVVVPAGGQIAVFIDALAPDVEAIAVHVRARSGRVVATLHHSLLRGLTPGGVDDVAPSAAAATRQVLPGVVVAEHGDAAVRVVVPGPADGIVRVRLIGPEGTVASSSPSSLVATVAGGAVHDIPLTDVDPGTYTALVDADVPVVAGALSQRTEAGGELAGTASAVGDQVPPSELAWTAATTALHGSVIAALPHEVAGVSAALVVAAPGGALRAGLREIDAEGRVGAERRIGLRGGASNTVPLAPTTVAVLLSPPADVPLHASVLLTTGTGMFSVVPVRPGPTPPGPAPQVVEDDRVGLTVVP